MKKIYSFALVVLTLLSSVIFFACGDKYKDLKMDFYSADGKVINELNLVIDNNGPELDLSYAKVGVKISGIDEDDIGSVLFYSSIPNLIDVSSPYIYDNDFVWVTISAKNPSIKSAKLMVRHLDSNKLASIDLIINKKSSGVNLINSNNKYIVSIPTDEGVFNEHCLNRNEILTLSPTGSTDEVLYKFADGSGMPKAEEIIYREIGTEKYVEGFKLNSNTGYGEYVLNPVTFIENYDIEPKVYTDKTITVIFDKTLTEENFVLKDTEEKYDLNDVIYLIKNDTYTNSLNIQLDYSGVKEDYYSLNLKACKTLPYDPNGEKSALFVDEAGDNVVSIQALAPTHNVEYAIIALTHPGYVGDIQTIEKVIRVKGELKPDYIQTKKYGEVVNTSETINIYDYYTSGSVFGTEFTFTPKTYADYPVYKDLQNMQIVIAPEILNIKEGVNGYNPVYTDGKFTELKEIQTDRKTNKNLLEITIAGRPLKFYYYSSASVCISEPITSLSKINIRYKAQEEIEGVKYENIALSIKVQTIYSGSLEYLKSVEPISTQVEFTKKVGVQSMVLRAGTYNLNKITPIDKDFDAVYLNCKDTATRLIVPTEIKGVEVNGEENQLDDETFIVSVVGGINNPLKISQGVSEGEGDSFIEYVYDSSAAETSKPIRFTFDENTDLGEYIITILQADTGFSISFKVYVYKDATNDDVSLNLEQKDSAFSNTKADGTKLYAEYDADYIVAAGEKLKLTVSGLSNTLIVEQDFVQNYDYTNYSISAAGQDVKTYFEPEHDSSLNLNETYLNFKKGTYVEGNHYITLTVKIEILQFEDIVTPKLDADKNPVCTTLQKSITFFIYEPITYEDISITKPMIKYMSNYLGAYYISDSIGEIEISMKEELWNYVKVANSSNLSVDYDLNDDGTKDLKINWFIDNTKNIDCLNNNSSSLTLQFNKDEDDANISYYTRTITAVINQFNNEFRLNCEIQVYKSIISEEVSIKSDVSTDKNGNYYINLKQGEKPYNIEVESYSSLGEVNNEEFLIMVFNKSGNGLQEAIDIDFNNLSLSVNNAASGLKLVVFAKDALKQFVSSSDSGFDNPASKLVDFDNGKYKKAFVVIDLIISDGKTEETAFIIDDADSFWNQVVGIDYSKFTTEELEMGAPFFKVLNNINLQNTSYTSSRIIKNFNGTIFTDNQNYKIYGLNLDNTNKNLFTKFDGTLKGLTFVVNYSYNNLSGDNTYLGVIDKNNGTLENVGCEVSGEVSFKDSNSIYFGGLVGENLGTIKYTDENKQSIGSVGEIELNDVEGETSAVVHFGGIVGKNTGNITGYEMEPINLGGGDVDFTVSIGSVGLMSNITIYSNLTNENSAVGGVIGLNNGTLTNAEVGATIISSVTNNVGGVVGANIQDTALSVEVTKGEYVSYVADFSSSSNINNIKSYSVVSGNNNIGGVVGYDKFGVYANIKYQVLADKQTVISGNERVGGIVGSSQYGKFIFCSVMSYKWSYEEVKNSLDYSTNVADIKGNTNVAGLVGFAYAGETISSNSVTNSTIIYNCSVNASIEEKIDSVCTIGGLLTGETNIIFNAYFIGKLTGDLVCSEYSSTINNRDFYLDNNASVEKQSYVNNVYSINFVNNGNKIGAISNNGNFNIEEKPDSLVNKFWDDVDALNGGYIYVVDKIDGTNPNPIFDVAPTKIEVTTKNTKYKILNDTIWLNYYNFTDSSAGIISNDKLTELINTNNKINESLTDLFNFTITPSVKVRLKVTSSRPDILQVTNDAKLIVKGVGECLLTFTSVLNSAVDATIKVVITYPVGKTVQIVDNITGNSAEITTQEISKDSGRLYSIISTGYIEEGGVKYYYETNSNINLDVEISYNSNIELLKVYIPYIYSAENWADYINNLYTYDSNLKTYDYVSSPTVEEATSGLYFTPKYDNAKVGNILNISGSTLSTDADGEATVVIPYTKPFSISIKERVDNSFSFVIKPRIEVENEDLDIDIIKYVTWGSPLQSQFTFTVETQEGASDVSLSYSKAILYPNDSTIINAYIKTDKQLTRAEINSLIANINAKNADKVDDLIKLFNSKGEQIDNNFITLKFFEDYGYKNGVHTIQFEVVINENVCINADKSEEKRELTIGVQVKTGVIAYAKYVILPQRINSIEIKNYLQDGTNYVSSNVLRQDKAGLLTLDIAPINGYFDYLEIVDVSGSEEIFFTQLTAKDGVTLPSMDKPATIGKGIQLIKNYTDYSDRLYIRTQVDSRYSSKPHTIKVYAFLSDGTLLTHGGFEYTIDVKMLPNITAEYRLPSGAVGKTATTEIGSSYDKQESFNLAVGTDAEFYITTRESDGIVVPKISAGWEGVYEFKQDNGNFYKLEFVGNPADFASYLGKDLVLTLETYQQTEIGYEVANIEFTITMQHFVVHNISLSNTMDSNGITQVYGNINQEVELEAYFKPTDISYYYNGEYNNIPYMFDNLITAPDTTKAETLKPINYINDILRTINNNPNSYLELKHTPKMETGYFNNDGSIITDRNIVSESLEGEIIATQGYATLSDGVLKVTNEDYNKFYNWELVVEFKLKLDNYNFVITDDTNSVTIRKVYNLNFAKATSPYEPELIKNEEDFYAMTTGYYILGADLILDNYTPLEIVTPQNEGDPQLIEFDGNGRTITITSFNTNEFTDETLKVGLFKNIPSGTTIKNLTVKYLSVSDRAENYSLGKVSSSRTVNDFVINSYFDLCKNSNVNYVSATFGGIAATNSGVITNCNVMGEVALRATTVEEKKFYSGDKYEISFYIGGVVATNESSGYITNSNSALRIFSQANIGGFVYENKGVIASSAVDDLTDYSLTDTEISDLSNGRFEHNGKTYRANSIKTYQPLVYNYNSTLSKTVWVDLGGFAVDNSGKISMSYAKYKKTALNTGNYIGNLSAKDISAGFVTSNSGNISDSYVNIEIAGNNSNAFYGFVYQNTGAIAYSYSYVNAGNKDNNTIMFALANTSGLENCIEIVATDSSYEENSSAGLYTIGTNVASSRDQYEQHNFAFGDNKSAIWVSVSGNLPTLVATGEKVVYTKNEDVAIILDTEVKKIYNYYGLKQITVTTEYAFVDGSYAETTNEKTDDSSYGTKNNPIIITNRINKLSDTRSVSDWELYFNSVNANKYFRIVQDIDFAVMQNNPITCTLTFSGNIQGNNMNLNNIMLYTTTSADSIGLFKEIIATHDYTMNYAIRNLTLTPTTVWASKVHSVGLLAGVIENYNLYNININGLNKVLVGGNAVGGVAGVVRGNFNLQRLSSNVGVNSTRATSSTRYSIYMSENNGVEASYNLNNVYYAGSVVGILDGYNAETNVNYTTRDLSKTYFNVTDIKVTGNISILADTAGAAFGFVGERVWVDDVVVNLQSARIAGEQYSSGAVGENRGVVTNVNVAIESETVFNNSTYVSAGVVGFNLGGLVQHTTANYTSFRATGTNVTLGGIIGRNIYGTVTDSTFTGKILAYFTGGIVGSNYQTTSLKNVVSGSGSIYSECFSVLPNSYITYKYLDEQGTQQTITNLNNTAIGINTLAYFLNNLNKFYTIRELEKFDDSVVYNKVLGLCIGVTDNYNVALIQNYGIDSDKQLLMFNAGITCDSVGVINRVVGTKEVEKDDGSGGKEIVDMIQTWPVANIITSAITYKDGEQTKTISGTYITYIIGAETKTFEAWDKQSYGPDRLVFRNSDSSTEITNPNWSFDGTLNKQYLIAYLGAEENVYNYTIRELDPTPNMKYTINKDFFDQFAFGDIDLDGNSATSGDTVNAKVTINGTEVESKPEANIDKSLTYDATNKEYKLTIIGYVPYTEQDYVGGTLTTVTKYEQVTYAYIFKVI